MIYFGFINKKTNDIQLGFASHPELESTHTSIGKIEANNAFDAMQKFNDKCFKSPNILDLQL